MIYSPQQTARILSAIESVMLGNNGYADIGADPVIADAVRSAGFVVIATKNLHGSPTFVGSTRAAQVALASEPFGVSTYKPIVQRDDTDWEAAILARQERADLF